RSEERFSRNAETDLVCRLLLEKKKMVGSALPPDEWLPDPEGVWRQVPEECQPPPETTISGRHVQLACDHRPRRPRRTARHTRSPPDADRRLCSASLACPPALPSSLFAVRPSRLAVGRSARCGVGSFFRLFPCASTCFIFFFFFNDTAPPEIYTLSLHDALPI